MTATSGQAVHFLGDVTGINAGIACIEHPTLGGCLKAAAQLGMTAATIASFGSTGAAEAAVEVAVTAAEDTATTAAVDAAGATTAARTAAEVPALTAAPSRLALTAGGGGARFAADSGGTVSDLSSGDQFVYRTWGGASRQWGHSWTPENPLTMSNARDLLGLPKGNAGIYLTRARVLDTAGVTTRPALPIPADGVAGGGPEWLFPDPANQLDEIWTIPVIPPF